jgi:hypothetical protein
MVAVYQTDLSSYARAYRATKGTAWVIRRSTDLVPALVALAVREWLSGSEELEPDGVPLPDNPLAEAVPLSLRGGALQSAVQGRDRCPARRS